MKTKKHLLSLLAMLLAGLMSMNLAACGDKDDEEDELTYAGSAILGTWIADYDAEGYECYIFRSNGTGVYECWSSTDEGREKLVDKMAFTYVYNEKKGKLTITEADGDVFVLTNVSIKSGMMYFTDEDGDSNSWEKDD